MTFFPLRNDTASWYAVFALALAMILPPPAWANPDRLKLPPGFTIEVYAENLKEARQMALGGDGTVYVGSMRAGKVYAIRDGDGDGRAEQRWTVARGLTAPSGIAFHRETGDLYIGAIGDLFVLRDIDKHRNEPPKPELVTDEFPDERHHGWKYLGFGPDGHLYIPVGAPCNICLSEDPVFAALHRFDLTTRKTQLVASGIRNTVGFTWHPTSNQLWFTDNGRDWLGDDLPAEELNVITGPGQHFGYPFIHAGDVVDPEFGKGHNFADYEHPKLKMQAHAAALGLAFYTGTTFPEKYRGALFIAQRGSWNRSEKVGYQVIVVHMDGDRILGHEPFVSGWLRGQRDWGRPNDVLMLPDGSLLISDDKADQIYRVAYRG